MHSELQIARTIWKWVRVGLGVAPPIGAAVTAASSFTKGLQPHVVALVGLWALLLA